MHQGGYVVAIPVEMCSEFSTTHEIRSRAESEVQQLIEMLQSIDSIVPKHRVKDNSAIA